MIEHGFLAEDCANLAFIVFNKCSKATKAIVYQRLMAAGLLEAQNSAAIFLRLSFEISLEGNGVDKLVDEEYMTGILRRRIKRTPAKPILYWHIPKCSGTSLNEAFSSYFYGTRLANVWPGYNFRPLVAYLIEHHLEEIPYASSVHLGMAELTTRVDHFAFTVLRDPARRCFSMYRQEMSINSVLTENERGWHHYKAFARYGDFWNYRNDRDFYSWLENIPGRLLERQLTTFSEAADVSQAANRILELDYTFFRDVNLGSEKQLFQMLEIEHADDTVPANLNSSNKDIALPNDAEGIIRNHLTLEYQLIDHLTSVLA